MTHTAEQHIKMADAMLETIADDLARYVDEGLEDAIEATSFTFTAQLAIAHALTAIALTMFEERAWIKATPT
jgi:hypothetical protein